VLYFLRAEVQPPDSMSAAELRRHWNEEAKAALKAMEAGAIKGLWKVCGQRVVVGVVDLPDNDMLDQVLDGLPIMQSMGSAVTWEVLPVRPYEHFAEDLRKAVEGA